jgi:chemotaxis protein MotC
LLGPGTLVEEAALRRSLAAAMTLGDAARFQRLAEQYVHTYLRSPYASQFADAFVAGVVALHQTIDRRAVADIAALMDSEQEKVIYLRIARQAAIEGLTDLASFAAAHAESIADDPRAELYSSLSSVTSGNVSDVLDDLARIERDRLSDNDRQLLDAVRAIATGLTTAPAGMRPDSDGAAPAVRPITPYEPDAPAPVAAEPAPAIADAPAQSRNRGPSKGVDASVERARATVAATRAKLANIDKVIGEMPQ